MTSVDSIARVRRAILGTHDADCSANAVDANIVQRLSDFHANLVRNGLSRNTLNVPADYRRRIYAYELGPCERCRARANELETTRKSHMLSQHMLIRFARLMHYGNVYVLGAEQHEFQTTKFRVVCAVELRICGRFTNLNK